MESLKVRYVVGDNKFLYVELLYIVFGMVGIVVLYSVFLVF